MKSDLSEGNVAHKAIEERVAIGRVDEGKVPKIDEIHSERPDWLRKSEAKNARLQCEIPNARSGMLAHRRTGGDDAEATPCC